MSEEVGQAVPASQRSSWSSFIKQIIASTGDLSSLTAPPFILSPTSLCEFPAYWGEPVEEFIDIANGKTPEERMLKVLTYFIATLKGQYTTRESQTGSEKKPLNPILGEQHFGEWQSSKGVTKLVAEQCSHHPPQTCYSTYNEQAGVSLNGHSGQKTSFSGKSILVRQLGFAMLSVKVPGSDKPETYLITLPRLRIDGILLGSPYIELSDESFIQSSTGFHTQIKFSGAGWVSGKAHTFKATVAASPEQIKSPMYVIEGQWTGSSKAVKGTKGSLLSDGSTFLDVPAASQRWKPAAVKDISQMGPWESRRVWKDVAQGIRSGNFDQASTHKSKLENDQRAMRKEEQSKGETWQLQLFDKVPQDQEYATLAKKFNGVPDTSESYKLKASAAA